MVSEIGNLDFLHFSCLSDLKNNSVHAFLYYPKVSGIKKDCLHFSKAAGKIIKINNRFFFFFPTLVLFIRRFALQLVVRKATQMVPLYVCAELICIKHT